MDAFKRKKRQKNSYRLVTSEEHQFLMKIYKEVLFFEFNHLK